MSSHIPLASDAEISVPRDKIKMVFITREVAFWFHRSAVECAPFTADSCLFDDVVYFFIFSYRSSNLWICWHWLLMRSARVQVWTVAVIDGTHIASGMKMGYKLSILMDLNCIRNFQAQTVADVRVSCYRWRTMHPVCNGTRSRSRLPPQGTVASPGIWSVDRFSWFRLLGSTLKKI